MGTIISLCSMISILKDLIKILFEKSYEVGNHYITQIKNIVVKNQRSWEPLVLKPHLGFLKLLKTYPTPRKILISRSYLSIGFQV